MRGASPGCTQSWMESDTTEMEPASTPMSVRACWISGAGAVLMFAKRSRSVILTDTVPSPIW